MKKISQEIKKKYQDSVIFYTPCWDGIIDVFIPQEIQNFNSRFSSLEENIQENIEEEIFEEKDGEEEFEEETFEENENVEEMFQTNNEKNNKKFKVISLTVENIREDPIPDDILMTEYAEDRILPNLLNVKLCGITGINDIYFEKRNDEWVITTEGSNLYELFSNPLVDKYKTMCNNMWEIYNIFGIEATRQFLVEEYIDVVCSDGTWVNSCHVELLVDIMCNTGSIISISRYGQKKLDIGPLSKSSFEESVDQFLKSGINGAKENTKSVSASIMLGKPSKTGTGIMEMLIDIPMILNNKKSLETMKKIEESKEKVVKKSKFTSSSFFS
jgi:hypothetical protein